MTPESWQQDARLAIPDLDRFEPVGWIDDQYILRLAAPPGATDLVGIDVRADPAQQPAIVAAVATRRAALTPNIDVAPGNHRFLIFVPVFDGDVLRGIVTAMVQNSAWFASLVKNRFADYQIALDEQGTRVETVAGDGVPAAEAWRHDEAIKVANTRMDVHVTPTVEHLQASASMLPEVSLALGALLATLLALCTYFFLTAQGRARDLATVNARLREDIEARQRAELAQRESEERTRLIIAAIRDQRHLHARCRRAHRHLESGRDRASPATPRREVTGPRFRAALPARRRAAAAGNAHHRRARRLDCRRVLAPAQGRQPLPRRRHDLGHPRQRRRAAADFRW